MLNRFSWTAEQISPRRCREDYRPKFVWSKPEHGVEIAGELSWMFVSELISDLRVLLLTERDRSQYWSNA